jgi:DNA-binding response OmpR family regulator
MPTQQRFKKILIVEDNIDLVHVLGLALELQGYEIIRATDGKQAINAVSLYKPDLRSY